MLSKTFDLKLVSLLFEILISLLRCRKTAADAFSPRNCETGILSENGNQSRARLACFAGCGKRQVGPTQSSRLANQLASCPGMTDRMGTHAASRHWADSGGDGGRGSQ